LENASKSEDENTKFLFEAASSCGPLPEGFRNMSRGNYNDPNRNYGGGYSSYNENAWSNPYQVGSGAIALQSESARTRFMRLTYTHLFGAILLFAAIETVLLVAIPDTVMAPAIQMMTRSSWSLLIVMGAFMGVSWMATSMASAPSSSRGLQYAGLALYTAAQAVIFLPLMWYATRLYPMAIPAAGLFTGLIFAGITLMMFITGANFSWLGRWLFFAGLGAIALILGSIFFGFSLGLLFIGGMILLASGYILYDTSNVMHRYHEEQYVAAALALFASVALLFYYALQLVMSLRQRD
jgi:FtsH-binding integral membrane protein